MVTAETVTDVEDLILVLGAVPESDEFRDLGHALARLAEVPQRAGMLMVERLLEDILALEVIEIAFLLDVEEEEGAVWVEDVHTLGPDLAPHEEDLQEDWQPEGDHQVTLEEVVEGHLAEVGEDEEQDRIAVLAAIVHILVVRDLFHPEEAVAEAEGHIPDLIHVPGAGLIVDLGPVHAHAPCPAPSLVQCRGHDQGPVHSRQALVRVGLGVSRGNAKQAVKVVEKAVGVETIVALEAGHHPESDKIQPQTQKGAFVISCKNYQQLLPYMLNIIYIGIKKPCQTSS
jgi:hypothetical protein